MVFMTPPPLQRHTLAARLTVACALVVAVWVLLVIAASSHSGKLFDLLNARKQLRALADHKEAVQIMGLSDRKVSSVAELLKVIDQGNAARSTGATHAAAVAAVLAPYRRR